MKFVKGELHFGSCKQIMWYVELMMMDEDKRKGVFMFFERKQYEEIVAAIEVLSAHGFLSHLIIRNEVAMLITTKGQADLEYIIDNLNPEPIGRFCGYPECCVQSFINKNQKGIYNTKGLVGSVFESCFITVHYKDGSKSNHISYISHIPCCGDCKESLELYRQQKAKFLQLTDGKSYKKMLKIHDGEHIKHITKANSVGIVGVSQRTKEE